MTINFTMHTTHRQGSRQRLFSREVFANGAGTGADSAGVVILVPPVDRRVELGERVDFGDFF
ncbi:hypothetical protein [Streptomyces sp. NBC_01320]|uniref:hypothetical protein n=1 Tax=Streptomyces sp. NBC_01320 TaxID=2903824 RepID=UPI002E161627|nr:hypothetical protein OG395_50225 [Streptomyces sp. NBC_01320]